MRNKYSISYYYPVFYEGKFQHTTRSKYKFKLWLIAKLTHVCIKFVSWFKGRGRWSYMCYISKYIIDTDLGISYQDEGPWRSYHLTASGDTLQELFEEASISEIDQDGGDLDHYSLEEAPNEVQDMATKFIKELVK